MGEAEPRTCGDGKSRNPPSTNYQQRTRDARPYN